MNSLAASVISTYMEAWRDYLPGRLDSAVVQHGEIAQELGKGQGKFAAIGTVVSILFFDGPVANYSKRDIHLAEHLPELAAGAPSTPQIAVILAVIGVIIILFCVLTRRFPEWAEAISLSVIAATISLGLATMIFKPLFERPDPHRFVYRLRDNFGWHTQGLPFSAFPSTHAALAAAGLIVWGLYFPRWKTPCIVCLFAIDVLLVIGGWHFISDVLAGNLVGVTVGALGYQVAAMLRPPRTHLIR